MRFFIFAIAGLVYQASSSPLEPSSLLINKLRGSDHAYGDVNIVVDSNLNCFLGICFDDIDGIFGGRLKRGLDNDGFNLRSSMPRKGEYACAGGVCRAPSRGRGATLAACPHCQFAVKP